MIHLSNNDIYSGTGNKLAYLNGNNLNRVGHSATLHTNEISKKITAGGTSIDIERVAVLIMFA